MSVYPNPIPAQHLRGRNTRPIPGDNNYPGGPGLYGGAVHNALNVHGMRIPTNPPAEVGGQGENWQNWAAVDDPRTGAIFEGLFRTRISSTRYVSACCLLPLSLSLYLCLLSSVSLSLISVSLSLFL